MLIACAQSSPMPADPLEVFCESVQMLVEQDVSRDASAAFLEVVTEDVIAGLPEEHHEFGGVLIEGLQLAIDDTDREMGDITLSTIADMMEMAGMVEDICGSWAPNVSP